MSINFGSIGLQPWYDNKAAVPVPWLAQDDLG